MRSSGGRSIGSLEPAVRSAASKLRDRRMSTRACARSPERCADFLPEVRRQRLYSSHLQRQRAGQGRRIAWSLKALWRRNEVAASLPGPRAPLESKKRKLEREITLALAQGAPRESSQRA